MSIEFQWDKGKALQNFKKHGVTFEEAATAFYDALSITISDSDHSEGEARLLLLLLGLSNQSHLLVVSHTDRESSIRIIGARPATSKERKYYETKE